MDQVLFGVGLRLDHPEPRTARTLRDRLFPWTVLAPAYPEALWHMAAALPQALVHPTPTFATAEWMLFCRYEAARRFLDPVLNYDGLILRALERFPVQIAGVYFEHLRFRIVDYLDAHGLTEWPDCLGRSRLNYGRPDTTPEQREANRKALLDVIETASYWFGRTLAHIGMSESLNEISSGRPVHYWIGGAGMPGPFTIPVLSLWKGSSRLITPSLHESRPFVTHGWPLPSYPVDVAEILSVAAPAPAVAPPDAAPAPSEAEVAAARMLQSGILLPNTSLPAKMTPPERELVNYLLAYKDPAQEIPFSHADIARILRCSPETIRRRHRVLEQRHPELKRLFVTVRHRRGRTASGPPALRRADVDAPVAG